MISSILTLGLRPLRKTPPVGTVPWSRRQFSQPLRSGLARPCHPHRLAGRGHSFPRLQRHAQSQTARVSLGRLGGNRLDAAPAASRTPPAPALCLRGLLGGNALVKWLGEQGEAARFVRAAAAICPPQDLQAGAEALSRGFNRVYCEYFLRSLRPKTLAMLERWPGLVDAQRVRGARDFSTLMMRSPHPFMASPAAMTTGPAAPAASSWAKSVCPRWL